MRPSLVTSAMEKYFFEGRAAKVFHREKIIEYFKEKVAELGIHVVV